MSQFSEDRRKKKKALPIAEKHKEVYKKTGHKMHPVFSFLQKVYLTFATACLRALPALKAGTLVAGILIFFLV